MSDFFPTTHELIDTLESFSNVINPTPYKAVVHGFPDSQDEMDDIVAQERMFFNRLVPSENVNEYTTTMIGDDTPPASVAEVFTNEHIFYRSEHGGVFLNPSNDVDLGSLVLETGEATSMPLDEYGARMLVGMMSSAFAWHRADPSLAGAALLQQAYVLDYVDQLGAVYDESSNTNMHLSAIMRGVRMRFLENTANISAIIPSTILALADRDNGGIDTHDPRRITGEEIRQGVLQVASQGSFRLEYTTLQEVSQTRAMSCPANTHVVKVYGAGMPEIYNKIKDSPDSEVALSVQGLSDVIGNIPEDELLVVRFSDSN